MHCKSCGKEFDIDEASEEFDSHFHEEFYYFLDGWEGFCADCAISNTEFDISEGIDDDYIPSGCAACGGDYPNCMSSCPLYDD